MTSWTRHSGRLILAGLVLTFVMATVSAQDKKTPKNSEPAPASEKAPGDEGTSETDSGSDSILQMILGSGPTGMVFMAVLGIFSVVAGTVAVERAVKMQRERVLPTAFVKDLMELAAKPETPPESYRELCRSTDAPVATVVAAGLPRFGSSVTEIEKALEDAAAREMAEIRAKIKPLSTIGGIAPLVGLLGTVVGMIVAFHTASQAGLGKAELLAKGIYMALLTTAGGLSVAIPSLMLAAFFGSRAEKFFRQMDRHLMQVLPSLAGKSAALMRAKIDQAAGPQGVSRPASVPAPTPAAARATLTPESDPTPDITGTVRSEDASEVEPSAVSESTQQESSKGSSPASSRSKNNPLMSTDP